MPEPTSDLRCSVGALPPAEWDALITRFSDATVQQTGAYARARWPRGNLLHFVARRGEALLAAAQVVVFELPVLGGGLGYVHFGPLWQTHESMPDSDEVPARIVGLLRREFVERRGLVLRVRPQPPASGNQALLAAFAEHGFAHLPPSSPDRFLVDLSASPEQLRESLHSKWRYHLKRAERHGLEVTRADDAAATAAFLRLYREMVERKRFADTDAADILPGLCAQSDGLRPEVMLCIHAGTPVAGAVVSRLGDTALYLFGASSARALELRAGYFLHWATVEHLRSQGCRWYDLGGDSHSPGLRQFKSGLVGRAGRVAQLPGDFQAGTRLTSRLAAGVVFGARERLRQLHERWRPGGRR